MTKTQTDRRKKADKNIKAERRSGSNTRRTSKPKRRIVKERREDMLIVSSASQKDIYIWALSMAMMVGLLATFIATAILIGGE